MKNRLLALLLALVMMCGLMPAVVAVSDDDATKAAQALYDLGLFQGTGANADGTPNFDLGRTPTRAEAVTMLVRLLGKEAEAKAGTWTTPFTDVDEWAKPYVGYAYANGLTTGTSATTFGGKETVDAAQYLTFVLRALGYESGKDFQWNAAWEKSDAIGLTKGSYNASAKSITRGDVAVISQSALSASLKDGGKKLRDTLNLNTVLTAAALQGCWIESWYYDKSEEFTYNSELGLFEAPYLVGADLGNKKWISYYIFQGNSYVSVHVGEYYYTDPQRVNDRGVTYNTGTFSVEGNNINITYDSYNGDENITSDHTALGLVPIQYVTRGRRDTWKVSDFSDAGFKYTRNGGFFVNELVKREAPDQLAAYQTYKPLVEAFNAANPPEPKNTVDSLATPVITAVYHLYSKYAPVVYWNPVPNAEGYELWYREGEYGKWISRVVEKDGYSAITYNDTEIAASPISTTRNVTYYFKVRAYAHNAKGEKIYSAYSNMVSAMG